MKKVSKVVIASIIALGFTSISTLAFWTHSGWTLSPVFPLEVEKNSYVYYLNSEHSTVTVGSCETAFTGGWLPEDMMQLPHDFPIFLYDQDPAGNADDKLKTYEGMFEGGVMTYVKYMGISFNESEPVDSEGDEQAELYINGKLKRRISGTNTDDPSKSDGESMFRFDIQVK